MTNALLHARSACTVALAIEDTVVRVEVSDASPTLPTLPSGAPPIDAVTGRGLFLVSVLAREWGVTRRAAGKCVWFEVAA